MLLDDHIEKLNRQIQTLQVDLTAAKTLTACARESEAGWRTRYNVTQSKINTMFTDQIMVDNLLGQVNHADLDDSFERRYIEAILQALWGIYQLE